MLMVHVGCSDVFGSSDGAHGGPGRGPGVQQPDGRWIREHGCVSEGWARVGVRIYSAKFIRVERRTFLKPYLRSIILMNRKKDLLEAVRRLYFVDEKNFLRYGL